MQKSLSSKVPLFYPLEYRQQIQNNTTLKIKVNVIFL